MKRYTMNMTLAVAALTLAAGTVSAQTMKAEIPFAFHVGNKVMQPGEYHVSRLSGYTGTSVWKLSNVDAKQSVLMVPVHRAAPSKEWTESRPRQAELPLRRRPLHPGARLVRRGRRLPVPFPSRKEWRAAHRGDHAATRPGKLKSKRREMKTALP